MPNRNETDIRVDYAIAKGTILEGLVATFRYGWLHQDGSPPTQTQLRAILNYEVRFDEHRRTAISFQRVRGRRKETGTSKGSDACAFAVSNTQSDATIGWR